MTSLSPLDWQDTTGILTMERVWSAAGEMSEPGNGAWVLACNEQQWWAESGGQCPGWARYGSLSVAQCSASLSFTFTAADLIPDANDLIKGASSFGHLSWPQLLNNLPRPNNAHYMAFRQFLSSWRRWSLKYDQTDFPISILICARSDWNLKMTTEKWMELLWHVLVVLACLVLPSW